MIFTDKKFRLPRIWSNKELKKVAHLFTGNIINVSAWKDIDKQGNHYKDYFYNAKSYSISNFNDKRGLQEVDNEFYLDLEQPLNKYLCNKFDVVFNFGCLEHIYNIHKAFSNLCLMSKDIVIIVIPFIQEIHTNNDYWRFTPMTINKLFTHNKMNILYLSYNDNIKSSVYLFVIATKNIYKWSNIINQSNKDINLTGCNAIKNPFYIKIYNRLFRKKLASVYL